MTLKITNEFISLQGQEFRKMEFKHKFLSFVFLLILLFVLMLVFLVLFLMLLVFLVLLVFARFPGLLLLTAAGTATVAFTALPFL